VPAGAVKRDVGVGRKPRFAAWAVALTVAALAAAALVPAAPSVASPAPSSVWVIPGTARAFPTTRPGTLQTIAIDAAGNEYQGVQVVMSGGGDHQVSFSWGSGSDPLIVANSTLDQVYYVNVARPTTGLDVRPGLYPDPLVPRGFDQPIAVPDTTTSFYLRLHVPLGTPGGDYHATLDVQEGTEVHQLPCTLHVWDFGWAQLSTPTGFSVSSSSLGRSVAGSGLDWNDPVQRGQLLLTTYAMLKSYGVYPLNPVVLPQPAGDGSFDAARLAADLAPYLDADGLGLMTTRIPWSVSWPWRFNTSYGPSSPQLLTYLIELCALYKQYGWQDQGYAYIMDETTRHADEQLAERYARLIHAASALSGYRMRFLLTDDPRPEDLGGVHQANRFLSDDVDIWGVRYFYFFGRIPALRQEKAAGKQVWWYTYVNGAVNRIPNFVIEKPNTDQRVWGWLMQRWNVDGLINWGTNTWSSPTNRSIYRDPYQDPLDWETRYRCGNGDCSLIYPGYYPPYGLDDPFAAPVSSLRLEALRTGLQDREYLRLARALPGGATVVNTALAAITQFPHKIQQKNVFGFPTYTSRPADYQQARLAVAQFIEARQTQHGRAARLAPSSSQP
jgi:hypothetical protein